MYAFSMHSSDVKNRNVDVLLEFLEVAVHNILYVRKIYPDTIYVPRKKYGVTVFQTVHPEVTQYIKECLKAVSFHAKKNQLKRLFVCFESSDTILERFVIDVLTFTELCKSDVFLVELEESLRTFMLKLHSSAIYLSDILSSDITKDITFSIQLEVTNISSLEFNDSPSYENFPWIEQSLSQVVSEDTLSIVPLHTIETTFLKLQMYVEK